MMFSETSLFLPSVALSSSIQSGWYQWSFGINPNDTGPEIAAVIFLHGGRVGRKRKGRGAIKTHSLNSSEKGTSFKKTHGYPKRLLNRSSSCWTLDRAPSSSEFLASMSKTAFARFVPFDPSS